jgi:hypothetical protein
MYERAATFVEYVKEYGLHRVEGVLLRYVTDAYKALVQTVPDSAKNDELRDVEAWLGAVVKQVDSSLLEEWERMRDPEELEKSVATEQDNLADEDDDITRDERSFAVLVRNECFRFVRHLARREWSFALAVLDPAPKDEEPWTEARLEAALAPYFGEHEELRTDPAARAPNCTHIEKQDEAWIVDQTLLDPDDARDHRARLRVDLEKSRVERRPVLTLENVGTVQ